MATAFQPDLHSVELVPELDAADTGLIPRAEDSLELRPSISDAGQTDERPETEGEELVPGLSATEPVSGKPAIIESTDLRPEAVDSENVALIPHLEDSLELRVSISGVEQTDPRPETEGQELVPALIKTGEDC